MCLARSDAAADGGGLGFSALGAGLVISTATAMVAVTGNLAPASLLRVTARSPVRALRLATGVQVRELYARERHVCLPTVAYPYMGKHSCYNMFVSLASGGRHNYFLIL